MNGARWCAVFLPMWIASCAGTVVVDYAIEAKVRNFDEGGRVLQLVGQETGVRSRPPELSSPFDWARYRDEALDWTFEVTSVAFGGHVINSGADIVCLRFDRATIASSLRESMIPLKVEGMLQFSPIHRRLRAQPGEEKYFTPPPICLKPAERATFSMTPELKALFPSGRMFDVSWPQGTPELTNKGAGNWVRLSLPTERGERTVRMEIQMTVVDSKARVSYY